MKDVLTPSLVKMIWNTKCLTQGCSNKNDHWTIEHPCSQCHQLGHSYYECSNPEELKTLQILIDLQFNPQLKERMLEKAYRKRRQIKGQEGAVYFLPKTHSTKSKFFSKKKFQFKKNYIIV